MENITGNKYGRLTVVSFDHLDKKGRAYHYYYKCKCDCGNEVIVEKSNLKMGKSQSCGCIKKEQTIQMFTKHNMRYTRLYKIWLNMKNRCNNNKSNRFIYYGGKGIKVCDEWSNDFKVFYDWSMNHGYADNLTIERIDNNKGYSPDNCRWATYLEQGRHTSRNHLITAFGQTKCIAEWSEINHIHRDTIYKRLLKGLTGEEAVKPVLKK